MTATYMRIGTIVGLALAAAWMGGLMLSAPIAHALSAPTVSNVTVNATTSTTANLSWNTGEVATSSVSYGTTTAYGNTSSFTAASTSHSLTLTGLTPSTTYHFMVTAQNASGTIATSSDMTFMTAASTSSTTAPVISNLTASSSATSSIGVSWTTDVPATTQVNYGTTTAFGSSTAFNGTLSTSHFVTIPSLAEATQYFLQVASGNSVGTTTATTSVTTGSTASSTPLAIDNINAVDTTAFADNSYADGWEWVITFTVPSNENQFSMRFDDFTSTSSSSTIPANGNIRFWSAQSDTATSSSSAIQETGNNFSSAVTLTGDSDTSTPGRQVQVHVQVKVPTGTANGTYSTTFQAHSQTP